MAYSAYQYSGGILYPEHASQIVIDSSADLADINLDVVAPGTRVVDCSSGSMYILSPSKQWKLVQNDVAAAANSVVKESVSGDIAVISDGADDVAVKSLVAEITPVQEGSGDPSPTNIRPISGRTGLTVTAGGSNLLNIPPQNGTVSGVSYVVDSDGYITLNGTAGAGCNIYLQTHIAPFNSKVTISSSAAMPTNVYAGLTQQNGNRGLLELRSGDTTRTSDDSGIAEESRYRMYIVSGVTLTNFKYRPMLNYGASALPYEPYTAQTYPVTWQTEAGTIYGGTLDLVSGVLTVTHALWTKNTATMNNREDYPGWKNSGVRAIVGSTSQGYRSVGNIGTDIGINTLSGNDIVYLPKVSYNGMSQTQWKELAIDVEFVLPLATPQTYQLTPTEIKTLLGGNTIYTDAGAVSVEYVADTKLYIDNKVAELQALILEN